MFDQLPSWAEIVGALPFVAPIIRAIRRKKPVRRQKRIVRLRHGKIGSVERTRLDVIDNRRL